MKKIFVIGLLCLLFILGTPRLFAIDSEPAGKNILNPARFEIGPYTTETHAPIHVLPNTTYTLSIPYEGHIQETRIQMFSSHATYIDEWNTQSSACIQSSQRTVCTFTTGNNTTELHVAFESYELDLYRYLDAYGFYMFQLELGNDDTSYEPYHGHYTDDTPPEFQGEGTLLTSYDTYLSVDMILGQYITAYDEIDGDLTDQIVVESDNYTGNEHTTGEYLVSLSVTDSSLNTALFDLHILVKDEIDPIITGPDHVYVDVDDGLSLATIIQDNFSFYDDYDGIIDHYVVLVDHYTTHAHQLGQKQVDIMIEDASGNQTIKSFSIHIEDYLAPTIEGPSKVDWFHSEFYDVDSLYAHFTVTDNYTSDEMIHFDIVQHNLPENMLDPGHYVVEFEAIDESGNRSVFLLDVEIHDDIAPTIQGPEHLSSSYKDIVTIDSLRQMLSVSDNYATLSLEDLVLLEDTYSEHATIPGLYRVIYSVNDGYNLTTHTVYIRVIDDVPPVFSFDSRITIEQGSTLSNDELLRLLRSYESIQMFDPTDVVVKHLEDDEHGESYTLHLELRNDAKEVMEHSVYVHVMEFTEDHPSQWINRTHIFIALSSCIVLVYLIKRKR